MVSIHHEVKDGSCMSCDDSIFQQKTLHLCIRRKSSEEVVYLSSSCFFILYCMIDPHPVAVMDVIIGGSWAKGTQDSELVLQLSVSPKLFQNEKLVLFFFFFKFGRIIITATYICVLLRRVSSQCFTNTDPHVSSRTRFSTLALPISGTLLTFGVGSFCVMGAVLCIL